MSTREERAGMPHAIYRCWNADDELLYVGRSHDPDDRWRAWLAYCRSPWTPDWPFEVTRREVEWFDSFAAAAAAEARAIRSERPRHNKVHNPAGPPIKRPRLIPVYPGEFR